MKLYACILVLNIFGVACKSSSGTKTTPVIQEEVAPRPSDESPTPIQNQVSTTKQEESEPQKKDLCDTNPETYKRENGQCVLIPRTSVEGMLKITNGVIWQPDSKKCFRPGFKFCSGGAFVTIPLASSPQGEGKIAVKITFNCNSFPPQNSFSLTIGDDFKTILASTLNDNPVFSSEISVSPSTNKSLKIDFAPNYSATYPADCKLYLVENRLIEGN